jgi:hypothetical protein
LAECALGVWLLLPTVAYVTPPAAATAQVEVAAITASLRLIIFK